MKAKPIRILVADDHRFIRRIVIEALKDLGEVSFNEVVDGQQALLELGVVLTKHFPTDGSMPAKENLNIRRTLIDYLVTDFNMPHVNGLQLLRMIRTGRTAAPRDLPVVMLTGFNDVPLLSTALQLDVNAFVTKPVAKTTLIERTQLGLKAQWDLKSVEAYEAVEIPELDYDVPEKGGSSGSSGGGGYGPTGPVMSVFELQEGAVLDEPLLSADGRVLLTRGTVLTESLIRRLREISEIVGIQDIMIEG